MQPPVSDLMQLIVDMDSDNDDEVTGVYYDIPLKEFLVDVHDVYDDPASDSNISDSIHRPSPSPLPLFNGILASTGYGVPFIVCVFN